MPDRRSFETHSAAETEALGARLARALKPPGLVLLSGELGAGKTAFVRGMARGLDLFPDVRVTSPTYVLLHTYSGARASLHHIDAYRIGGGVDEFEASGLMECLDDPSGIVCVEWPEKVAGMKWPDERISISMEHLDPAVRGIELRAFGPLSNSVLESF